MSTFIRCQWLVPPDASMSGRIADVARILSSTNLVAAVGPRWFLKGWSRKEALEKEVVLRELDRHPEHLERVRLKAGVEYLDLDAWNGRASGEDATLSATLQELPSPTQLDQIVLGVDTEFLHNTTSWDDVLVAARSFSKDLGGCALVSSHELLDEAKSRKFPRNANDFVYGAHAIFWGVDRSVRNPLHRWLAETGRNAPFETVACKSWDEVRAFPEEPLRALAEEVAAVSAAAGGGMGP